MNASIFSKVDGYIEALLATEDKALTNTIASLEIEKFPQHSISATQGKLLQVLMAACNAKKVLELGTLGGYSTIWLARALPEDGKLLTVEADAAHARLAGQNIFNAGLTKKVEIKVGNALDILIELEKNKTDPFDFIFIDADKPPYTDYFEYAVNLSRKGTIIVCDNVIREGKVLDLDSMDEKVKGVQRFNEQLSKNDNVTATILQTVGIKEHDGMAISVVK